MKSLFPPQNNYSYLSVHKTVKMPSWLILTVTSIVCSRAAVFGFYIVFFSLWVHLQRQIVSPAIRLGPPFYFPRICHTDTYSSGDGVERCPRGPHLSRRWRPTGHNVVL